MASAVDARSRRFLRTLHETATRDRISWRGMLVLSAFWFAIAYTMQPLGGNIIPLLVARFTHPMTAHLGPLALPLDVNTYVSVLDTIGAAFAIVWQPAIGALSDNSRFSLGRRRPYIAIGVIGDIIFLTLIAFVTSYWTLLAVYVFFQMASNTAQGPYQGMLPDQVPADQRGEASGYYGLMNMVGTIIGFLVVGALLIPTHHLRLAILTLPIAIAIAGALAARGEKRGDGRRVRQFAQRDGGTERGVPEPVTGRRRRDPDVRVRFRAEAVSRRDTEVDVTHADRHVEVLWPQHR